MMWGYGYSGWIWMMVAGVVIMVGIVILIVFLARNSTASPNAGSTVTTATLPSRQILDERYARGELTTAEYRERIDNLGGAV